MENLHWHEKKLLVVLRGRRLSVEEVARLTGLSRDAVFRASELLRERNLVEVSEKRIQLARLGPEGERYARLGLPERRLVRAILNLGKRCPLGEALEEAKLTPDEQTIALGWARRRNWISLTRQQGVPVVIVREEPSPCSEEQVLELLSKGPVRVDELSPDLLEALEFLKRRGRTVILEELKERVLSLTSKGSELAKTIKVLKEVSFLTPQLIRTGRWRKVRLRKFDVEAPGPTVYPGKYHPLEQIIQEIRMIFLEMGFEEIRGPLVETAFWNFDALFQPQDHPAREMHDTFYLLYPTTGSLPSEELVERVAKTHECGWETGSTGWGYRWNPNEAKRLLLRTHTTAATIRYLAEHREPPVRVFSVDRVYRNEKVDKKHLAEFHHFEGIVMEEGATVRDLMGIMKTFFDKLGLKDIRFRPSYFPYTEPSLEAIVYVPELGTWIELVGMGIFRPEVVEPLGIKCPVLAWGGGLERVAMLKLGVDDIRYLYQNDLRWLRGYAHLRTKLAA